MNPRTISIGSAMAGRTLGAAVKSGTGMSWTKARALLAARRVSLNGATCSDETRRVRRGDRIVIRAPSSKARSNRSGRSQPERPRRRAADAGAFVIVYSDRDVVVVEKPAGLTTMRHADEAAEFGPKGQRYLPPTLMDFLAAQFPDSSLRAVHRIDRDTSGLVVFACNPNAERHLSSQFRRHAVMRRYRAIVRGTPPDGRIESTLVRDRGDGRRGSGSSDQAKLAITHVMTVERLGPCTLIECRLETGRTHQIRIHLGEAGAPLAGETVYDRPMHGSPAPDPSGAPRLALHAATLGFAHPSSGQWMEWESPMPADLNGVIRRLRALHS